ncbi:Helix-turn-helix [Tistlia consotensis]|uniref:Helix-turn-helix n=1 Tax=Tistlia consotensis USBA 355 TaxID=560819 RepID=A0A1Y6BCV5_9PROT|nr:helix-turn-helix transcriptional regulator [Tistlia consotensis]SMF02702.1 Helix-turn-helix [Tistlia consotensis USBA 355]SNR53000.1 Helix-turn-helix [Tistlia consotensis]
MAVRKAGRAGSAAGATRVRRQRPRGPAPAVQSAWFLRRLSEIGETQRALARFLEADPSTVSKMLSGVRRIRLEEAEQLSRFLRVPLLEVLEHAGVSAEGLAPEGHLVPLVGRIDGAGRVLPDRSLDERIELPLGGGAARHPGLVALRLEDPESLMDGWTFFYAPSERVEAAAVGRLAVVRSRGGRGERLAVVETGDRLDSFRLDRFDGRRVTVRLASAAPVMLIRP